MSRCANKIIRYTLVGFSFWSCLTSQAQKVDLFGGVGYSSYSHQELKDYQQYLMRNSVVNATITDEFPAYHTYLFGVNVRLSKWMMGVEVGHGSTGGRVYYQDYSGSLIFDQMVKYNYAGFSPAFYIYNKNSLCVTGGIKLLLVWHQLGIRNSVTIGSQTVNENKDFYGLNLGVQPNISLKKYFGKVFLQASAGYELQSNSYPETKDDPKLFLNNGSDEPVHLQGNGYRLSLCTGLLIGSKN